MHLRKENSLVLAMELPLTHCAISSSLWPSLASVSHLSSVHLAQLLGLEVCFREVSLASDTPWCWGGMIVGRGSS